MQPGDWETADVQKQLALKSISDAAGLLTAGARTFENAVCVA